MPASGRRRSSAAATAAAWSLLGPDDDRRARARERDAGLARDRARASSASSGASGSRNGSCRTSWNALGEQLGVARGDRSAEQRRLGGGGRRPRRAGANSGRRERDALVFTRVCRDDDDRRERQVGRDPLRLEAAVALRQIRQTPPSSARREVVGVALERQPELEQQVERHRPPAAASPATSPAATVAADEPSPRSSGIRLTNRKRWPSSGRDERERPQREMRLVARQLVGALALERRRAARRPRPAGRAARSRGRARRRRSRTRGRGWPVVAGARTTNAPALTSRDSTSARIESTSARRGSRRGVSGPRPRRCP